MLRTFSKAYGLAGLRIGYAVGDPDVITALGKVYVPFTATTRLAGRRDRLGATPPTNCWPAPTPSSPNGARVTAALARAGLRRSRRRRPTSSGCRWPSTPLDFVEQAANARVLVRPYGNDGVRVTVGAPEENDAFLAFAADWIKTVS